MRTERPIAEDATFNLETFLPHQLAAAAARVSRLFGRHYADHYELSLPEWQVIAFVGRHAGISPTGMSGRSALDKVKVSRAAKVTTNTGPPARRAHPCGQAGGHRRPARECPESEGMRTQAI